MTVLNIPEDLLPAKLKEVTLLCNHQTAMVLLLNYGGVHLSVPRHPNPLHRLAELLGWQAFRQLCGAFGGEILSIPKAAVAIRQIRNDAILTERRQGRQLNEIAWAYGLTERHVMAVLSKQ